MSAFFKTILAVSLNKDLETNDSKKTVFQFKTKINYNTAYHPSGV